METQQKDDHGIVTDITLVDVIHVSYSTLRRVSEMVRWA